MYSTQLCTYVHTSIVSISKRFTSSLQILVYQLPLSCSYGNPYKGLDGYLHARITGLFVRLLRAEYGRLPLLACISLLSNTLHKVDFVPDIPLDISAIYDRNLFGLRVIYHLLSFADVLHICQTSHGCGNWGNCSVLKVA